MSTVYVVLKGEAHEGGSVIGVFYNEKVARELATAQETHFEGGWSQRENINMWCNGCDYVSVESWDVQ